MICGRRAGYRWGIQYMTKEVSMAEGVFSNNISGVIKELVNFIKEE
jgi:hypothetical protein